MHALMHNTMPAVVPRRAPCHMALRQAARTPDNCGAALIPWSHTYVCSRHCCTQSASPGICCGTRRAAAAAPAAPSPACQRCHTLAMEQDILALTRQWEAHRTIRSGDTPGSAMGRGEAPPHPAAARCGWSKGDPAAPCSVSPPARPRPPPHHATPCTDDAAVPRPALAPIPLNCASEVANPFSFTAQRHKAAAGGRRCSQGHHLPPLQQQQQQYALVAGCSSCTAHADAPPRSDGRADSEAGGGPGPPVAAAAATPIAGTQLDTLGRTFGGMAAGSGGGAGTAAAGSPSPYVLFRGRLSFAAEADSGRLPQHRRCCRSLLLHGRLASPLMCCACPSHLVCLVCCLPACSGPSI